MSENTGADGAIREIEGLLEAELEKVRTDNRNTMIVGGVVVVLVAGYLVWANSQVGLLLDPEGLALAATGVAMEAVPEAGGHMEELLVDGAPDLAVATSQYVVEALPVYRQILEDELRSVVDEVTSILAETAVREMVVSVQETDSANEQIALQAAADAAVGRLDTLLDEAMDEPMENDGPTPREAIDGALVHLETVDRGLKQLAMDRGKTQEREFLLAWLGLVNQFNEEQNLAALEQVRIEGAPPEPAGAPE